MKRKPNSRRRLALRRSALHTTTLLSASLAIAIAAPAQAQQIGTVASARQSLDGAPPGASARTLRVGANVVQNERITTSDTGSAQLLFKDQTTLAVAPSSNITLNRYVFNADANTGEMALSMTRGALRFIGGAITNNREATIDTPVATIGVRGGMVLVVYDPAEGLTVIVFAGSYARITNAQGETLFLSREGAVGRVPVGGGPAQFQGLASADLIDELFSLFEGPGAGPNPDGGPAATLSAAGFEELGDTFRGRVSAGGGEPVDPRFAETIEFPDAYDPSDLTSFSPESSPFSPSPGEEGETGPTF